MISLTIIYCSGTDVYVCTKWWWFKQNHEFERIYHIRCVVAGFFLLLFCIVENE